MASAEIKGADIATNPHTKNINDVNVKGQRRRCKKIFRPLKVPRYLPGSVSRDVLRSDLKMYNMHRYLCFCAESLVDSKPPVMNPYNYVKSQKFKEDTDRYNYFELENKKLIEKINLINRTKGQIDCWNPVAYDDSCSRWEQHQTQMKRIARNNVKLYKDINAIKTYYPLAVFEKEWAKTVEDIKVRSKYPLIIFNKRSVDARVKMQPSISGGLEAFCYRPKAFMDLQVKNGVFLGRIIIELYVDYAPVTCQNFLSICKGDNNLSYKNCPIHRIVKGQYCETGDITKGNGKGGLSIFGAKFAEEKSVLKHTKLGVLSMIRVGDKENNSQFSISFKALDSFDGKRVVFGHVIKGNANLRKVDDLGRKIGAPSVPILISKCGEIGKQ